MFCTILCKVLEREIQIVIIKNSLIFDSISTGLFLFLFFLHGVSSVIVLAHLSPAQEQYRAEEYQHVLDDQRNTRPHALTRFVAVRVDAHPNTGAECSEADREGDKEPRAHLVADVLGEHQRERVQVVQRHEVHPMVAK